MGNNPVIEVKNLYMQFGPIKAVKDISFEIQKGEVIGLLGPNGAGKTTTIRILTTYLVPTSGSVHVFGENIQTNPIETRKKIGYFPELAPLYSDMEVLDYLTFVGKSRGLSGKLLRDRLGEIEESCQIKAVLRQPIFELSKGYKQRVGLAQSLIHDPEILIFDEPTSGLDPLQILGIRDLIRNLSQTKTIFFSTHILQEASAVTNRVLIIHNGQLIADGSIKELQAQAHPNTKIDIIVEAPKPEVEDALMQQNIFQDTEFIDTTDNRVHFTVEYATKNPIWKELDRMIKDKNWPLIKFAQREPTLEETFIALTDSSGRESGNS